MGTPNVSSEQHKALRHAFDKFDENGDGFISMDELDSAMLACGYVLLEDELSDIMTRFDKDRGGTLCFDEFCEMASERSSHGYADGLLRNAIQATFPNAKCSHTNAGGEAEKAPDAAPLAGFGGFFELFEDINKAFEHFDEDGDGSVTAAEIGGVLRELGQTPSDDELRAFVEAYDDNESGALDFDEFCNMMVGQVKPDGVDQSLVELVSSAARKAVSERKRGEQAPQPQH